MNVWTDIAIGNLQRHRGPPLDIDIETYKIKPMELFRCMVCGEEKPESGFYQKYDKRNGKYRRQSTCSVCICKRDIARRPKNPRKPRPYQAMLDFLGTESKTLREMYEALNLSRRMAQRMIYKLIDDGLVAKSGKSGVNRDPSNPPLYKKTTTPAAPAERV